MDRAELPRTHAPAAGGVAQGLKRLASGRNAFAAGTAKRSEIWAFGFDKVGVVIAVPALRITDVTHGTDEEIDIDISLIDVQLVKALWVPHFCGVFDALFASGDYAELVPGERGGLGLLG